MVVVPAYDEEDLLSSIKSLQCCEPPKCDVEVLVVFNASAKSDDRVTEKNQYAKEELEEWYQALEQPNFTLHCLEENKLPPKHAGVGLARKIGMDEAVRRFDLLNNPNGIICCYDADSKCEKNYFVALEKHFKKYLKSGACSIHFEHPLEGTEFKEEVYHGIYWYELHLRYYKNALQYAQLPYAYHTIGSSMAVRAKAYCEQGGMNRRKAGEDFYFLQKFIDVGTLTELKSTKVIPSPRASHRVPFGTGRAIQEMIDQEREIEKSYAFKNFELIKECFSAVQTWYHQEPEFHPILIEFVGEDVLQSKYREIHKQSTSEERFVKRFFQWFNAFQLLKLIHFLRDHYYENQALETEVAQLLKARNISIKNLTQLEVMRKIDRD